MVTPEDTQFFTDWDLVSGAANYNLYLATAPGVTPTNYLSLPGGQKFSGVSPPYYISGLTNGVRYYVIATAMNKDGESLPSAEVSEVFGPNAELSGSIYMDLNTGGATNPVFIAGMQVQLINATNGIATPAVMTDGDGTFTIPPQPPGPYILCYSFGNSCGTICTTQFNLAGSEPVSLPPLVYTSSCSMVYGVVYLDGSSTFQITDPFFGLDTTVQVKLINGSQTNTAQVNQSGEFVFAGVPPGSYVISADCDGSHIQQSVILPTANPIFLILNDRAPVVQNAYALDPNTGQQIFRAQPGATVQLVVEAFDPDGDPITYDWFAGSGDSTFHSTNSPSVLWQLPNGSGIQTMYFIVRDYKGGYETGKIEISTDPTVLFTGTVLENGAPPVNGALVTINQQTILCDSSGYFSLQLTNPVPPYVMAIQSQGCEPYSKVFWNAAVGGVYSLYQSYEVTVVMSGNATVTNGSIVISFPSGSVVDQFGQPYGGSVTVTFSAIDPADPAGRLPGNLNQISGFPNSVLMPYAGASVALRDQFGNPLFINPNNRPQISVPLGTFRPLSDAPIQIWLYNPTNGFYFSTPVFVAGSSNTNSMSWQVPQTGVCVAAVTANAGACITLEVSNTISLPVDVTISSPAVQVRTITEPFTTFPNLPTNQLVTFQIFQANEATLTNGCVISNSVTTGGVSSNCANVTLAFPGAPKPGEMLSYTFGPGDADYGNAYYKKIDPQGSKLTFENWLTANGYNSSSGANAFNSDAEAIYFNNGDLGFGRWMGMKTNVNGDIAYFVSNYKTPDDAITARNTGKPKQGLLATVCMEYSADPTVLNSASPNPKIPTTNTNRYTKFYIFNNQNQRISGIDLDHKGDKFVPHLCIICHGGEKPAGDPNVKARFLPFDLESFKYSANQNFNLAAQSTAFKALNAATLRTVPTPAVTDLVQGWYGGPGLPGNYNMDYIPSGWNDTPAHQYLYANVVKISCRSCHVTRTGEKAFLSFTNFNEASPFFGSVICGGEMPNALRTFNIFGAANAAR